jgi:hypothetical protein
MTRRNICNPESSNMPYDVHARSLNLSEMLPAERKRHAEIIVECKGELGIDLDHYASRNIPNLVRFRHTACCNPHGELQALQQVEHEFTHPRWRQVNVVWNI